MIAAEGESFFLFSDNGARLENGNQAALIFDTKTGVFASAYQLYLLRRPDQRVLFRMKSCFFW